MNVIDFLLIILFSNIRVGDYVILLLEYKVSIVLFVLSVL